MATSFYLRSRSSLVHGSVDVVYELCVHDVRRYKGRVVLIRDWIEPISEDLYKEFHLSRCGIGNIRACVSYIVRNLPPLKSWPD